ncbi:TonB-dependent receptor plug domain-containing protein [Thiorhodococcus minor]|uniref:TonB-dependent receptor n=1 Tax=Thiorhodococcus minor TaxID=57489 RepID=A0A6M0JY57_9GAMM|nr:TonB-dependent receptor [Thiorhodococcus minor]NEV62440.1 TonB-dependent receptor [Thiorhodococcus minor]
MRISFHHGRHAVLAACGALLSLTVAADSLTTLKRLSLEELADLEVSIVSRRPERLADSAAAVYVLTAEDIRRSGYTSIPELLRLVPGFAVARIDTAEWAIGTRGFNGRFANKLLVMIDGRSVYTPLFSGVFWEAFDTLLEDIERIEVIRGPGASSWGSNAVNGVVNIITKRASETQGGLVSGTWGDRQHGGAVRYGTSAGERGAMRIWAKYHESLPEPAIGSQDGDDDLTRSRAGFRGDWDLTPVDSLSAQGDLQSTDSDDPTLDGGDVMLQWDHVRPSGATDSLRLSYERGRLETGAGSELISEDLDTIDTEYRHRFVPWDRHDLNWGLGYRWYRSRIQGSALNGADPANRVFDLFSTFVQDEITLLDARWYLTLGAKIEHNDFTGWEIQPSVRLRWTPQPSTTLWGAISRAVRTPSRGELDLVGESAELSGESSAYGLPVVYRTTGTSAMESETLIAYEAGYRWRPSAHLGLDVALFYNDYDELRTLELSAIALSTTPYPRWVVSATPDNLLKGQTYGADVVVDWRPTASWKLQAWYSILRMQLQPDARSTDVDASALAGRYPQQQAGLRAGVDLSQRLALDVYARFVDQLPDFDLDAYLALDARLAWRLRPQVTLALVGRNLLDPTHVEYGQGTLSGTPHEIAREVMVRLELQY